MRGTIEKIQELKTLEISILEEILEAIGYGSLDINYEIDMDWIDCPWNVEGEDLKIAKDRDTYGFVVDSYAAKGDKFFIGDIGNYTYVLAYDDMDFRTSYIFVLKTSLRDRELEY